MAGKGNFLSNKLLDHVLGGPDYTRTANDDFALYTVAPTGSGGGTEVTGGAYVRQNYTNNVTNWPAAVSQQKKNGAIIAWATATANWGIVVAAAIFAGGTSNLLYYGNLTATRLVNSGDSVRFAVNGCVITES